MPLFLSNLIVLNAINLEFFGNLLFRHITQIWTTIFSYPYYQTTRLLTDQYYASIQIEKCNQEIVVLTRPIKMGVTKRMTFQTLF